EDRSETTWEATFAPERPVAVFVDLARQAEELGWTLTQHHVGLSCSATPRDSMPLPLDQPVPAHGDYTSIVCSTVGHRVVDGQHETLALGSTHQKIEYGNHASGYLRVERWPDHVAPMPPPEPTPLPTHG